MWTRSRTVGSGSTENLAEQWYAYSTDRQMGRAREFLADDGIRAG